MRQQQQQHEVLARAVQAQPRIGALLALQSELVGELKHAFRCKPARTVSSGEGEDAAATFATESTLYRMEGYTGQRIRWLLNTTMAKATDGFTMGGVRVNSLNGATTSAPNFDFEVYDYGKTILMYLNLPARVDLLMEEEMLEKFYKSPAGSVPPQTGGSDASASTGGGGGAAAGRPAAAAAKDAAAERVGSVQDLLKQIHGDPDTTLFWSPSPHVRLLQAAGGITVTLPPTEASLAKIAVWSRRALSVYLDLAAWPGAAVLDPRVQASLEARDGQLLQLFRKDADLHVLEKEFGKEGTEAILRMATKDPRAMLDERRD